MKNKKILIVEDEQIIAENLRFILNEYGYHFVDVAMDVAETNSFFENTLYDLVLMDINLGDTSIMDGIDLIKLLSIKYSFVYLYVTANADEKTVDKAKETSPIGYIVKPFIKTSIYANVEMALNTLKKELFFSYINKGMQYRISLSKITYIEADGAYAQINTLNGTKNFIRKSLIDITELYPSVFIRIHKSFLINKQHIQGCTSQSVKINNTKLPLGRAYKQCFEEQIKEVSFS